MNRVLYFSIILFVIGAGCVKKPEIGLTIDNFSRLKASKVNEMRILTVAHTPGGFPYHYYFTITDTGKIDAVIECMRNAKPTEKEYTSALRLNSRLIVFETRKASYSTRIAWDEKSVYGTWDISAADAWMWESAKLREHFRQWNLIEAIAAADPNWPDPKWVINPPEPVPMPPIVLPPEQENRK